MGQQKVHPEKMTQHLMTTVVKIIAVVTVIGLAMLPMLLDVTWQIWHDMTPGFAHTLFPFVPVFTILGLILYVAAKELGVGGGALR